MQICGGMLYPAIATLTSATVIALLTYEIIWRAPYDYIKLKKDLRFKWVNLDEYVKEMRYPLKAYEVVTEDDYILTVHRIPHGVKLPPDLNCLNSGNSPQNSPDTGKPPYNGLKASKKSGNERGYNEFLKKTSSTLHRLSRKNQISEETWSTLQGHCERLPVLIVHGVLGCSGTMMVHNSSAIAYVLADAGFDTWLYNSRGTMFSRKHKTLNADKDPSYWDFSYHEMGFYDLKATVDLVLDVTKCSKIIMIGYSMGNSVGVAFLADRPEYQDKIAQFFALAPAIYLNHMESDSVELIANFIIRTQGVAKVLKLHEMFTMSRMTRWSTAAVCGTPGLRHTCKSVIKFTGGDSGNSMDETKFVEFMRYVPAGVSLQTLQHLAQQLKNSKCFGKYDYGAKKNKEVYGSEITPCYDLAKISTPFCIYHGLHDSQVTVQDADRFANELSHVTCNIAVPFNHFDFMWSKDGKALVYDEIVLKSNKISCEFKQNKNHN